jgi:hypothetical protein
MKITNSQTGHTNDTKESCRYLSNLQKYRRSSFNTFADFSIIKSFRFSGPSFHKSVSLPNIILSISYFTTHIEKMRCFFLSLHRQNPTLSNSCINPPTRLTLIQDQSHNVRSNVEWFTFKKCASNVKYHNSQRPSSLRDPRNSLS